VTASPRKRGGEHGRFGDDRWLAAHPVFFLDGRCAAASNNFEHLSATADYRRIQVTA